MKESPLALKAVQEIAPRHNEGEAKHALLQAIMEEKYPMKLNEVYRWVSWEDTSVPGEARTVPGSQLKYVEHPKFPVLNQDGSLNNKELNRQREKKTQEFMIDCGFIFNPEDGKYSVRTLTDPAINGLPIKLDEVGDRLGFTYKKGANLDWFPSRIHGSLCIHGEFPTASELPATPVEINVLDIANSGRPSLPRLPEQFQIKKILVFQRQLNATPPEVLEAAKANGAEMVVLP